MIDREKDIRTDDATDGREPTRLDWITPEVTTMNAGEAETGPTLVTDGMSTS